MGGLFFVYTMATGTAVQRHQKKEYNIFLAEIGCGLADSVAGRDLPKK